jgi:hypothetical protein
MNKPNPQNRLIIVFYCGLAGLFVVILAIVIVFVAAFSAGGLSFGGGIHSWSDNLVVSVFVPVLISLGAAIPAWGLGAKWWHGLLAGTVAMMVFIGIESNGGQQVNYGLFSQRETLAYISAVMVSTFIAILGRKQFQPKGYLLIFAFLVIAAGLMFIVPEEQFAGGFIISLLAWILLPSAVAFYSIPE